MELVKSRNAMEILEPATHLDHLMRQTRMHHIQLSAMADVKASMMLTLASLVITFSIGYLSDPYLQWPVTIMIFFCGVTILTSAYAVMPKVDLKHRPDLNDPNCNILFFGNFMNLSYDEYSEYMSQVMCKPGKVYETQLREVYELGVYLGRKKYRYIRFAYGAFICGLIASSAVFILVEIFRIF
jgi:hypothetical protein